jgi:hypothetical protein
MVLSDLDVIEHGDRIVRQNRSRAIERDQVRGKALIADTHEAYGKTRALLAGQPGLKESDHSLLSLSNSNQEHL